MINVRALDGDGTEVTVVKVDFIPDQCPICKLHIAPIRHYARLLAGKLYILHQCTNKVCREAFLSVYRNGYIDDTTIGYRYISSHPQTFTSHSFTEEISSLSQSFVSIYNQAAHAESLALFDICGPGYRKALEFLVKDYLIHNNPEQENEIKSRLLMACVRTLPDGNIKFCAERATWLGNDETHYTRKWEEQDLNDLKNLITLTVNYVTNERLMERYRSEMAEGR
ncbi:MAG: hypothetical protein E6Y08_11355 [Paenibacillus sp.]|uniref:hypothetical protein n=1 Tax=Paenibacillus sp. TaxID=58172 RepID=UPI0029155749|nr:hypothetical protein [Paenibacillus sp.]MDU4696405.1 hypothetical protein [Paenibacillus sp.]